MLIVIDTASDSSLSFNDVIDIVPAENSFAQNISDRFSMAGMDPMDTSCVVALRSTSKPIVEFLDLNVKYNQKLVQSQTKPLNQDKDAIEV